MTDLKYPYPLRLPAHYLLETVIIDERLQTVLAIFDASAGSGADEERGGDTGARLASPGFASMLVNVSSCAGPA